MDRIAILGATGTIGSTLARRLVAQGCRLFLVGRNQEKLSDLSLELKQPSAVIDLSRSNPLEEALVKTSETDGSFQGLVNCIGSVLLKPAHTTSEGEFRQVIETNLVTAFFTIRAGAKLFREQGGSIVLLASAAAEIGIPNHEAIAAAKAGVIGLARSAAASYAARNIRVNVISPGLIRTDLTRSVWENTASAAASRELHALGRLGEPEHVASLAAWLLDPENHWVTGQVIGVDGGLAHVLPRRRSPT